MEALRRPARPEDAVRSRLFAAAAAAGPGGEALLRRCAELALVRLAPLLAACVWQRQPFRLRYVPGRGEPGAGREARREERPERGDCEGEPAAGNRERVKGAGRVASEGELGEEGCEGNPAAGNQKRLRGIVLGGSGGREPGECEGHRAAENRDLLRGLRRPGTGSVGREGELGRVRRTEGRGCEIPAHLGGTAVFGNNVEDEWFIVLCCCTDTRSCAGADLEELDSDDVDEEEEFGFSDEDDEELDAGNGRQEQKVSPEELVGSLKAYMEEMDRELAQTNVGKSFSSHKRGASSVGAAPCESAGPDCGAEAAELAALDVDTNLVAKLLESYSAQAGLAGPTSSILQSLGVNLPEGTELPGS
ncbi:uncharacterized protein RBU47_008023 [Passerculus sandwichensis]